jgi:hypothetical protein
MLSMLRQKRFHGIQGLWAMNARVVYNDQSRSLAAGGTRRTSSYHLAERHGIAMIRAHPYNVTREPENFDPPLTAF